MALTLKKVAIKDPNSSDVVILSNIMDGVDGAAAFGFSQEGESAQIEDNQTLEHTFMGDLDIKVLRASASDKAIIDGLVGKPVEVVGWGISDFIVFDGNPTLNRETDFNSNILNDRIHVTTKTAKGFFLSLIQ